LEQIDFPSVVAASSLPAVAEWFEYGRGALGVKVIRWPVPWPHNIPQVGGFTPDDSRYWTSAHMILGCLHTFPVTVFYQDLVRITAKY